MSFNQDRFEGSEYTEVKGTPPGIGVKLRFERGWCPEGVPTRETDFTRKRVKTGLKMVEKSPKSHLL